MNSIIPMYTTPVSEKMSEGRRCSTVARLGDFGGWRRNIRERQYHTPPAPGRQHRVRKVRARDIRMFSYTAVAAARKLRAKGPYMEMAHHVSISRQYFVTC
jgi:hypothetical protein